MFCTGPGDDEVALYSTTLLDVHPGLITSARLDVLPFWIGLRSPRSHCLPFFFHDQYLSYSSLTYLLPSVQPLRSPGRHSKHHHHGQHQDSTP